MYVYMFLFLQLQLKVSICYLRRLFSDGNDYVDEDCVLTVFVVESFSGEVFERLQVGFL